MSQRLISHFLKECLWHCAIAVYLRNSEGEKLFHEVYLYELVKWVSEWKEWSFSLLIVIDAHF